MSLLLRLRPAAGCFVLGFISDIAATRFSIAAPNRWIFQALAWNAVLMILSVKFVRNAKSNLLAAAWIIGNLLGCWAAFLWQ
jgi:hypothetical protein